MALVQYECPKDYAVTPVNAIWPSSNTYLQAGEICSS